MKNILFRNTGRFRRNGLALLATLLFSTALFITLPGSANAQALQQAGTTGGEITDPQLEQTKQSAYVQHEIVKGLVEQGHFDQVLPEMRKLFALDFPDSEEHRIAESASIIARLLVDRKQFATAHQVLDEAFTRMSRNADKAAVLKINAWVYKEEGKLDLAVEIWNRAIALEKIIDKPLEKKK